MTNHTIDNSCASIGNVVLWQYDKAYHLLLLIRLLNDLYNSCVRDFWDNWNVACLSIDTCSDFGAMVWGIVLGLPRPNVLMTSTSTEPSTISLSLYRKLLKAELFYKSSNGSFADVIAYLSMVFQTRYGQCGVTLVDHHDMSVTYEKTIWYDDLDQDQKALFERAESFVLHYPIGIKENRVISERVFGFAGQENTDTLYKDHVPYAKGDIVGYIEPDGSCFNWECQEEVIAEENISFDSIRVKFVKTFLGDPFVGSFVEKEMTGFVLELGFAPDPYEEDKVGIYPIDTSIIAGRDNTVFQWPDKIHYFAYDNYGYYPYFSCYKKDLGHSFKTFLNGGGNPTPKPYNLREIFPQNLREIKPYQAGVSYLAGWSLFRYNGKVYVSRGGISSSWNTSFDAIKNNCSETWWDTTFICQSSLFAKAGQQFDFHIDFRNAIGDIVSTYDGSGNVTVQSTDIAPTYDGAGVLSIFAGDDGKKISVNLDAAAEKEGKLIYSTATIGDIIRYLHGTIS